MCAICLLGWLSAGVPRCSRVLPAGHIFSVFRILDGEASSYGAYWLAGTWSLAIEEQFYLVFPLIVRLVPIRFSRSFWLH